MVPVVTAVTRCERCGSPRVALALVLNGPEPEAFVSCGPCFDLFVCERADELRRIRPCGPTSEKPA